MPESSDNNGQAVFMSKTYATIQGIIALGIVWIGTTTWDSSKELVGLTVQVNNLKEGLADVDTRLKDLEQALMKRGLSDG